ncbi:MAG: Grx4 family monothiol glutaredoxin [Candidatus Omnitrophica bacterium]|nr:Grx4 family monothiol glutaredoxin [Candidatus Omnitrophota bacterium]
MSEEIIGKIKSEIESNKVILFMKGTPEAPQCGFSAATVQILKGYPYPFASVDVLSNPDVRATLPKYSNWPTFPQLFIDGELIGGCDIVHELNSSGELEQKLKTAFAQ